MRKGIITGHRIGGRRGKPLFRISVKRKTVRVRTMKGRFISNRQRANLRKSKSINRRLRESGITYRKGFRGRR